MPTTVDNNEEQQVAAHGISSEELQSSAGPADDLLSRVGCDMDSGFSGSSSASYRYFGKPWCRRQRTRFRVLNEFSTTVDYLYL